MKTKRVRVLVVEDHFLARLAITNLIEGEADLEVVARAETGWQAVEAYRRMRPDLVLMDLRLPEMDGVRATEAIRREDAGARILVLSHYDTEEDVRQAVAMGALGFLGKDVDGETLLQAMRLVARGARYLPAELEKKLEDHGPPLSRREHEVLKLLADGLTNPQIAAELDITEGTARIHVSNVLAKLGASRRGEAVALAHKRGLLRSD